MINWLRGKFLGGETVNKSDSLQESIRAWENNETGINPEKRKAIHGDNGELVEVVSVGDKNDPSFAILLNCEKHQIKGNLDLGLPSLIGALQQQSEALSNWTITSVQRVTYEKDQKNCYFLSGYPTEEVMGILADNGPIQ